MTTVSEHDKVIVVTEGEFDAMAVHQATNLPAVSLPNGANSLPTATLHFFDRFDRIYLWLDADSVGQSAAEKFSSKLGHSKTLIVNSRLTDPEGPKDANDALLQNRDLSHIIRTCTTTVSDRNLLQVADLKDKVLHRILNAHQIQGIPSQTFQFFNKMIKGLRNGEFTLVTGASGSGKTTFLSQLSIDFCR